MPKNRNDQDVNEVNGLFVYHTHKYKNVYYDIFTKNAYLIGRNDVQRFRLFSMRGVASLLVGFACFYYLKINPIVSILLALAVYLIFYLLFRFTYLNTLYEIKDFERPESQNYIDSIASEYSFLRIAVMILLAVVFVFLCIINIRNEGYTGTNRVLNILLAVVAAVFAVIYTLALFKKKNSR